MDQTIKIKNFNEYIKLHECPEIESTHNTLNKSYKFIDADTQTFMEKYIDVIESNPDIELNFMEKSNEHCVSLLTVVIKIETLKDWRQYTTEDIEKIIEATNDFINDTFDVTEEQLKTIVLEKDRPTIKTGNTYIDGFKIYYPYLPLKKEYRYYVLNHLISLMNIDNDAFLYGVKRSNNDIFDISVIKKNGLIMYGSTEYGGVYNATLTYNAYMNKNDNTYSFEDLVHLLSNQQYDEDASYELIDSDLQNNVQEVYDTMNEKYVMSEVESEMTDYSYSEEEIISEFDLPKDRPKKKTREDLKNIAISQKICGGILSIKRLLDINMWSRIGYALHSVDESLYVDFVNFSIRGKNKMSLQEKKDMCVKIWKDAENFENFYSIETLRHWAKIDNPKKFYEMLFKINEDIIENTKTQQHVDIAKVVYELYKDRFVCVNIEKKKWYEFQNHKWVIVQSAYTLENLISDELRQMFITFWHEKVGEHLKSGDGKYGDAQYKQHNTIQKTFEKLGDVKFRSCVISACSNLFFDGEFQKKLDSNVYLIGFKNGIYDLKEMCFRDGLPSDYVSMSVGYDWKTFNGDEPVFHKIDKFFSEIQVEQDMKNYVLTLIASIFRGIPDQKIHIWTGSGGNGKSAVVNLIQMIMGQYFGVVPITILTRKRGSSSGATPELADKFGKRLIIVQEPEHNDVIFVGVMKELSGKDTIQARPLYGDPFTYVPQFKWILTCNNLPNIPSSDDGTWRRLRATPFESKMVDANPVGPLQFLKDESLEEEFPKWTQAFMWLILTKYYKIYDEGVNGKKYKYVEPDKVKLFTKNYKMDTDIFMEFIETNIKKTDNRKDTVGFTYLYDIFREWYKSSYTNEIPNKKELQAYLKKADFELTKTNLLGAVMLGSMS